MDTWLSADWPAPANIGTAITTRRMPGLSLPPFDPCNLGSRCGDDALAVAGNRRQLRALLGLPSDPVWLHQVHGAAVVRAEAGDSLPAEPEADAATTSEPGIVLAILTADCLPVFFCSQDGLEISLAHAGWRGLAAGVLEQTIASMRHPPEDIMAWIGPAIAQASYEVGDEVHRAFVAGNPAAESAFSATRPGHWLCDLPALARLRLQAAGVSRIGGGGFDTRSDPRFYSHRRSPVTGRFASLAWIR